MNTSCKLAGLCKWSTFTSITKPKQLNNITCKALCTVVNNSSSTTSAVDKHVPETNIQQPAKYNNYRRSAPSISKTAKMVDEFLTTNRRIQPFVDEVTKLGISEYQIVAALIKIPDLTNFDLMAAASCLSALHESGFTSESILSMMTNYPELLHLNHRDIQNTMETWRSCHLGEKFQLRLFTDYPQLLNLDNELIKSRIHLVKHYMDGRLSRVTDLLLNSPEVLYANWYQTEYKLNYLMIKMGVNEKQIAESKALSHPISHIKLRHSFLDKTGVYKTPNPKKNKGFSPHKNPPLRRIVDTDDYTFAINVARLTLDEYESYKQIFANYIEEEKETFDDESDSENEEDNSESDPDDTYEDYRQRTLD